MHRQLCVSEKLGPVEVSNTVSRRRTVKEIRALKECQGLLFFGPIFKFVLSVCVPLLPSLISSPFHATNTATIIGVIESIYKLAFMSEFQGPVFISSSTRLNVNGGVIASGDGGMAS